MSEDVMKHILQVREQFGWNKTDTMEYLIQSMIDESIELQEAYQKQDVQEIPKELADVLICAYTIAYDFNLDINEILHTKLDEISKREY